MCIIMYSPLPAFLVFNPVLILCLPFANVSVVMVFLLLTCIIITGQNQIQVKMF